VFPNSQRLSMSSSYNRYFSPSQVESDQKDLIISQLKAEIFELRQNERDYHDLSSNLRNLEHRYNLLSEEKIRGDGDYKGRNDVNLKVIANLKTDIDVLKSTLAEKNIEYQENKAENLAIKDIADHRAIDISKLKNELSGSIDQNNRLKDDKRSLESNLANAKDEKRKLLGQLDGKRAEFEELNYRTKEFEKILRELEYDRTRGLKQQDQLQQANDNLNLELRSKNDTLRKTEDQIGAAERDIRSLEAQVSESERTNEKAKAELIAQQKSHQQETSRGLELQSRIKNLENTLRSREIQLDDLRKDLDHLNNVYKNGTNSNHQLNDELADLTRQIEKITLQNQEIVSQLEEFSQEDERVRSLLNRRGKVSDLKSMSESQLRQSPRRVGGGSPTRRAASPRRAGSPQRSLRASGQGQRRY